MIDFSGMNLKFLRLEPFERKVLNWIKAACSRPKDERPSLESVWINEDSISATNGMIAKCVDREAMKGEIKTGSWLYGYIPVNGLTMMEEGYGKFPDITAMIPDAEEKKNAVTFRVDSKRLINILKDMDQYVVIRVYEHEDKVVNTPIEIFGKITVGEKSAPTYSLLMPAHLGSYSGDLWRPSQATGEQHD